MLTTMVPGTLMLLAAAPIAVVQAQNVAQHPTVYETVTIPVNAPNAQIAVTTVALSTVTVFGSEPNSALATIVISPDGEQSSTAAVSISDTTNGAATSSVLTSSAISAFPSLTASNGTSFGNFTNTTWPAGNSTSITLIDPTGTDVGVQESNTAHEGKPVDTAGNAKSAAVSETYGLVNSVIRGVVVAFFVALAL